MTQNVYLTIGIPASGKTTWARDFAHDDSNVIIVSRDDIRHAHNWKSGFDEDRVTQIHRNQIEVALLHGYDVIVADTNINPRFRRKLIKFCHEHGADVILVPFPISLDEAILRDDARTEHKVGADVVTKFYNDIKSQGLDMGFMQTLPVPTYAPYVHRNEVLGNAVVVDVDGTLAHMGNRNPYDESQIKEDEFDHEVAAAVQGLAKANNAAVIVVTGRTRKARRDTQEWLESYGFDYYRIETREEGDVRPDYVVKNEIYDTKIIPSFNILAVFDDRDQVVRHLRARGIKVFQVAPGRF
jgi:predicted kinase